MSVIGRTSRQEADKETKDLNDIPITGPNMNIEHSAPISKANVPLRHTEHLQDRPHGRPQNRPRTQKVHRKYLLWPQWNKTRNLEN